MSTGKATPSTQLAPGLQSQRTDAAISSERPSRAIGWSRMISLMGQTPFPPPMEVSTAGAHGIDPNATRRIVQCGALCQPDYSLLGRVIGSPARLANEAAKRGTVDNGTTALGRIWSSSCFMQVQTPRRLTAIRGRRRCPRLDSLGRPGAGSIGRCGRC
jgi:hypothetical protein